MFWIVTADPRPHFHYAVPPPFLTHTHTETAVAQSYKKPLFEWKTHLLSCCRDFFFYLIHKNISHLSWHLELLLQRRVCGARLASGLSDPALAEARLSETSAEMVGF